MGTVRRSRKVQDIAKLQEKMNVEALAYGLERTQLVSTQTQLTFLHDTQVFGGTGTLNPAVSADTLVFESFSLSDGTNMVLQSLRFLGPTRDLVGDKIPRADGEYLTADYFREYVIEASGIAVQST